MPIVLDADGLNAFAGRAAGVEKFARDAGGDAASGRNGAAAWHARTAEVQARRMELAAKAAADWNCYVILKGPSDDHRRAGRRVWVNSTGNPGMGTGGTGDVLTGMLAGPDGAIRHRNVGKSAEFRSLSCTGWRAILRMRIRARRR